jgi:hypothetical protein
MERTSEKSIELTTDELDVVTGGAITVPHPFHPTGPYNPFPPIGTKL